MQVSIWPNRLSLFEYMSERVGHLRMFISTASEPERLWKSAAGRVDVVVQKTISVASVWRHPLGFRDKHYLRFPIDSYMQLRCFRPDVTLSLELGFRTLMASLFRVMHPKMSLIVWVCMTEHQQKGHRPLRHLLRKLLVRCADAVIANGSSAKRCMLNLGYPEEQIFIAPTVCDLRPFLAISRSTPASGDRRLVYVGRLVEGKGLLQFLARLDEFAHNNPTLDVIFDVYGYGPLQDEISVATHSANLDVRYKGPLLWEDLPRAYASADIFVFPTLSDEWGLVVNEAMASGLPVLGSRYSQAVEDLVDDGSTGWIFAPDNVIELDGAIERALQSSNDLLHSMGQRARQAVGRVSPDSGADAILLAINYVLSSSPTG